jgi:hypothetical protein
MMSLRAIHYLKELLGFITGARDEKPSRSGPFQGIRRLHPGANSNRMNALTEL